MVEGAHYASLTLHPASSLMVDHCGRGWIITCQCCIVLESGTRIAFESQCVYELELGLGWI